MVFGLMRRKIVASWRNVRLEAVDVSGFYWLDREQLAFYQDQFGALGFEVLGDYAPSGVKGAQGFTRVLGHRDQSAHLSLYVSKANFRAAPPLRCSINSWLEGNWVVAAGDREADPILSQLALPRVIALRDCDAAPAALWAQFLEVRAQLMREKQLGLDRDTSIEAFLRLGDQLMAERSELLERLSPFQFAVKRRALMRAPGPRRFLTTGQWTPQTPPLEGIPTSGLNA